MFRVTYRLFRWTVIGLCMHTSAFGESKPAKASVDLRQQALHEIKREGKRSKSSTDAQVAGGTGMLSLEDPMPKARDRAWDYFLRFALQVYSPSGRAGNDLTNSSFSMDPTPPALMPALTAGLRGNLIRQSSWSLGWGLGGRIAYTTEKGHACFTTGFCEKETQLNTLMTAAAPELVLRLNRLSRWSLTAGAEIGNLNYTQSSGNKFANFSASSPYAGYTAGLDYSFNRNWSALFAYTHRSLTKNSRIGIQADNYELGTRLTW